VSSAARTKAAEAEGGVVRGRLGRWALAAAVAAALGAGACNRGGKGDDAAGGGAESKGAAEGKSGGEGRRGGGEGKGERKGDGKGGGERAEGGRGGGGASGRGGGGPQPVRVAQVERRLAPRLVAAVAPLAGRKQADVFSKVTGRIASIGPREGAPVKQGDVLFRVDRSDPGEVFLNTPVQSPLTGWIGRWAVTNVGEQVTPSAPVVTVVDDEQLKAVIYLPASDWVDVKPDTKITAALGEETREARIETIARAADPATGRGSVTVVIDNPKRDWRAGVFAKLTLALDPRERILISSASLVITDQGAYVYVADGEVARRVRVEFRLIDGDTVEITKGLEANTQVVVAGVNLLGDQSAIKIVN
jgi:multidrug efflux pump subunit AcrA (membrane-fusion protein)